MAPIWNLRLYIIWLVFFFFFFFWLNHENTPAAFGKLPALFTTPLYSTLRLQPLTGSSTAMATRKFLERDGFPPLVTWESTVSSHFVKRERYINEVNKVFRSTPKLRSRLPQARRTHPRMERYQEQVPTSKIHTSSALNPISIVRWTLSLDQFITSSAKQRLGCRHTPSSWIWVAQNVKNFEIRTRSSTAATWNINMETLDRLPTTCTTSMIVSASSSLTRT